MKYLTFILAMVLHFQASSQELTGCYAEEKQYLCFNEDSTVDISQYIYRSFELAYLEEGKGSWKIIDDYLIIDIYPSHFPTINSTVYESTKFIISDLDSNKIYLAHAAVFDKTGDLLDVYSSDFNGELTIENVLADSVFIESVFHKNLGFKIEPRRNYELFLLENRCINNGQLCYKMIKNQKDLLELKFLFFNSTPNKINRQLLRKLKTNSLVKSSRKHIQKLKKTSANKT